MRHTVSIDLRKDSLSLFLLVPAYICELYHIRKIRARVSFYYQDFLDKNISRMAIATIRKFQSGLSDNLTNFSIFLPFLTACLRYQSQFHPDYRSNDFAGTSIKEIPQVCSILVDNGQWMQILPASVVNLRSTFTSLLLRFYAHAITSLSNRLTLSSQPYSSNSRARVCKGRGKGLCGGNLLKLS